MSSELERALIQERVKAGIARARTEGKHLGRPRINGETEQAIQVALAEGKGIRKVARECGVGVSVVSRFLGLQNARRRHPARSSYSRLCDAALAALRRDFNQEPLAVLVPRRRHSARALRKISAPYIVVFGNFVPHK